LTAAEQKAYNRALSQVRVHIEHCIGWIKNWAIHRHALPPRILCN
jgi:hypothetical protein